MAKLSALVIPAVIDTSGVDRGINQIKSKMSRVRGSGGIGGGIAPGHSAGIVPFGVGDGFGGAGGAAMGAAFGAAIANRAQQTAQIARNARIGWSQNLANMTYQQRRDYRMQSFGGRIAQNVADFAQNRISYLGARNFELRNQKYPGAQGPSRAALAAQLPANQAA